MIKKLNILFLPEWYPDKNDAQQGVFIEKHANAVSKFHNVTVIYVAGVDKGEKYFTETSGTNPKVIRSYYKRSFLKLFNFFRYSKAYKNAVKETEGKNFDLAHLHVTGRNYFGWKMFFKNIPYVITEHWSGFAGENSSRTLISASYTKQAFEGAKRVSTVSEFLKKRLEQNWGVKNIEVIPNIIEKAPAVPPGQTDKKAKILCVADLYDENKNISGIIEVISKVNSEIPFILTIIGDGPSRKILEKKAADKKLLNEKIFFTGRKDNREVLEQMAQCDFLIMNSRKETFSMVCAEAIYAGKPVIATKCGGPEEFVHAQNGILIDIDDGFQLKNAITNMLKHHNDFESEKMAKEMEEKFGKKHVTFLLEEFYFSALGERP